jgi:hypothetical protein
MICYMIFDYPICIDLHDISLEIDSDSNNYIIVKENAMINLTYKQRLYFLAI